MSLEKKSVIQIAILLVLVAVGAGAYLTTQEGGLDIAGLLPGAEAPTPPPPPPKVAKPAAPAIPSHPARGQIGSAPFEPDTVVLNSGVLEFVQAKEPQSAVLIPLPGNRWETPVSKNFKFAAGATDSPRITINQVDNGKAKTYVATSKYVLTLEFGKENEGTISGKLKLEVPGEEKISLAGTFNAKVEGFRIVDGKPVLSADSPDTLEFLALQEVLKEDPDKPIDVVAFRDHHYVSSEAEKNRSGYVEMEYRIGQQDPAEIRRFQFVKDTQWKIVRTLGATQIEEAHPHVVPGPKDEPSRVLTYLAAKRLEAEAAKKPKSGLYGTAFLTTHDAKKKLGAAEVTYRSEPAGPETKTTYVFRLTSRGWVFDRELKGDQKFNVKTGKIATAKR